MFLYREDGIHRCSQRTSASGALGPRLAGIVARVMHDQNRAAKPRPYFVQTAYKQPDVFVGILIAVAEVPGKRVDHYEGRLAAPPALIGYGTFNSVCACLIHECR